MVVSGRRRFGVRLVAVAVAAISLSFAQAASPAPEAPSSASGASRLYYRVALIGQYESEVEYPDRDMLLNVSEHKSDELADRDHSLAGYADACVLVRVPSSNHSSCAPSRERRINDLQRAYADRGEAGYSFGDLYHGAGDDDSEEARRERDLRDGIEAALVGETPSIAETPPVACTVKWRR